MNWTDYHISQAILASIKSPDAQTKVGAVLTTKDNRIITTGFNGFVPGAPDDSLPKYRPDKYPVILHAEKNILLSCVRQGKSTFNSKMYVYGTPCWACFYDIIGAGVEYLTYTDNPFLKSEPFNETEQWERHKMWLLHKINLRYIPLKDLEISKKIFDSLYGQVYNNTAGI